MILADTSVWIAHLRNDDATLAGLLEQRILGHPFVTGEILLGNPRGRAELRRLLSNLPAAPVATEAEVLGFIEARRLFGRGIGYVDAHLLTAVQLNAESRLWTLDMRLRAAAEDLGLAAILPARP